MSGHEETIHGSRQWLVWELNRLRAENQRLWEALVGLMDALHTDEDGNLCSALDEWADAWSSALLAALAGGDTT